MIKSNSKLIADDIFQYLADNNYNADGYDVAGAIGSLLVTFRRDGYAAYHEAFVDVVEASKIDADKSTPVPNYDMGEFYLFYLAAFTDCEYVEWCEYKSGDDRHLTVHFYTGATLSFRLDNYSPYITRVKVGNVRYRIDVLSEYQAGRDSGDCVDMVVHDCCALANVGNCGRTLFAERDALANEYNRMLMGWA